MAVRSRLALAGEYEAESRTIPLHEFFVTLGEFEMNLSGQRVVGGRRQGTLRLCTTAKILSVVRRHANFPYRTWKGKPRHHSPLLSRVT
jgi:hypothetical protein